MECNFENCPNFERLGKKFADKISELEQENAELKAYKDVNEDFKTAWEELKAENERLKKEIRNNKSAYQVELGTYNMECGNLLEENKQLLQTLQEIKEMILYCDDEYDCDKCRYHDKCQPNEGEFPDFSKALLQKITKAEEE